MNANLCRSERTNELAPEYLMSGSSPGLTQKFAFEMRDSSELTEADGLNPLASFVGRTFVPVFCFLQTYAFSSPTCCGQRCPINPGPGRKRKESIHPSGSSPPSG
jgi:hypothetical protein